MAILNLTQHPASPDQLTVGVIDVKADDLSRLKSLLTFATLPSADEIQHRAKAIANLAAEYNVEQAMIGGAGYLMPALETTLRFANITPLHAFSIRVSVEEPNKNGEIIKTTVFKHVGFVDTA